MDREHRGVFYGAVARAAAELRNLPAWPIEPSLPTERPATAPAVLRRELHAAAQLPLLVGSAPVVAALRALLAAADILIDQLNAIHAMQSRTAHSRASSDQRALRATHDAAANAYDAAFSRYLRLARADLGLTEINGEWPPSWVSSGGGSS
jgi:hypothetical protein